MISGKRNYINRADKNLSNVMSSFGIYETAIDTYGEPQKEFVSADGIEKGLVYDGITAIYRERGAVRLQITDGSHTFGPKKISVGTDKSVILNLFKNADNNEKTVSTCVGYTDSGEKIVYEDVYVYYSDDCEVGMGFKFNSEDKVEIIFVLYGL